MSQSKQDLAGKSHAHGWGVATYDGQPPQLERQAWAAYHGEHFQRAVSRIYAELVIAHVRRATVGGASLQNTHPFSANGWVFAHNGTVPRFGSLKGDLINKIAPHFRSNIQGQTDSEHIFYYVLSLIEEYGDADLFEIMLRTVTNVEAMVREVDADARIGLNLLLTDGKRLTGVRFGRTLHYIERDGVHDCEICGFPHIHHEPRKQYRALVVASEPISHEKWVEIPDRSVWISSIDNPEISIRPI